MSDASDTTRHEHSGSLRGKVPAQQLDLLIRRMKSLPASPTVAADVLALAAGNADLQKIASAAACDPSISAQLLSLACNQQPGRLPRTIAQAVEAVGIFGVRSAVMGMKVFAPADAGGFDYEGFRTHCVAVACASELLAKRSGGKISPSLAYTAGLLHDIGKIALYRCLPGTYRRIISTLADKNGNIARVEQEIIGTDHTRAGRRLAQQLSLPVCITEAIWLHHHPAIAMPETLEMPALVAIVQLADVIVRRKRLGFSGNYTSGYDIEALANGAGLSGEDVACVEDGVVGRLKERMTPAGPKSQAAAESSYRSSIAEAGAELSRINEALVERAETLTGYAEGLKYLGEFAERISPTSSLSNVCEELVRVFSSVLSIEPSRDVPVCAFAVCDDTNVILAVCSKLSAGLTVSGETEFRFSSCRRDYSPPSSVLCPVEELVGSLLRKPNDWSDLIDLGSYAHLPMVAEGRLIGGVLLPRRSADSADVELLERLTRITAFILAAVVGRSNADRLAEELAGASQRLEQTQDALARSHSLAVVGEMAAGAAHEMNNPLAVISGRAQLLAGRVRTQKDRESAELIADKALEISDIMTDLMAFARPSPPNVETVVVADLLERARNTFESERQQKALPATVDIKIESTCPSVLADPGQMEEVLVELLRNAATAADGQVNVSIRAEKAENSSGVLIQVRDDGPGMEESTLDSVFTPFFSHRRAGRGRGMGLTRAKRSVENNGGRMWIESTPGKGTTVFIELPAVT